MLIVVGVVSLHMVKGLPCRPYVCIGFNLPAPSFNVFFNVVTFKGTSPPKIAPPLRVVGCGVAPHG